MLALSGTDCDSLLSRRHDDAASAGRVLSRRSDRYPINPQSKVLDGLPRGTPIALAAAAYDRDLLLVARGCRLVTLGPGHAEKVDLELKAWPVCSFKPTMLDVVLVLDTSAAIAGTDPANVHLTDLVPLVVDSGRFPASTRWSIVTHDGDGAAELLPPTTEQPPIRAALQSLELAHRGTPRLYDAVYQAAAKLRARGVCTVRPAMLVILSAPDIGSTRLLEEAAIEIIGSRGDDSDDIFTFGIGLSRSGYEALSGLIPEQIGRVIGAQGETQIRYALGEAAMTLSGLVRGN